MRGKSTADVLIVGAGPAGLAAAHACADLGCDFELLELGATLEQRDHDLATDLGHGVGGAGLYSDGKFSFYPSATALWALEPKEDVVRSYQWLSSILASEGVEVPEFPTGVWPSGPLRNSASLFAQKSYPSVYLTLESRTKLIAQLQARVSGSLQTGSLVTALTRAGEGWTVLSRNTDGTEKELTAKRAVILASGRFGPLLTQDTLTIPQIFRRMEVGVRIEQPSGNFFLAAQKQLDPKYTLFDSSNGVEWRTFCCCRQGEVVSIRHKGLIAVSGRSDVAETGFSNVGFHVRLTDEVRAMELWGPLLERIRAITAPARMPLSDFVNSENPGNTPIGTILGPEIACALVDGISHLLKEFSQTNFDDALLYAPALEGLGTYPHFSQGLKISTAQFWGAGDATGQFRGLVAALVSGYFAGLQVAQSLGGRK